MTYVPIILPHAAQFWDGEDCYTSDRATIEVEDGTPHPYFTGLLNANGDRLMRMPDTVPLGFHIR